MVPAEDMGKVAGFLFVRGQFSNVVFPGSSTNFPYAINDGGGIAGTWIDSFGNEDGFTATP